MVILTIGFYPRDTMINLSITQCKPNPSGKDRFAVKIPNSQLAGEWVDFYNSGYLSVSLTQIVLYHTAYTQEKPNGVWSKMCGFSFTLPPKEIVRVHAGGIINLNLLTPIDRIGANYHIFTGKNYTLNNDKPEEIGLYDQSNDKWIDIAKYRANPPEGKILERHGDYLI